MKTDFTLCRHQFWLGLMDRYKRRHLRQHVEVPPPVTGGHILVPPSGLQVGNLLNSLVKTPSLLQERLIGPGQASTLLIRQAVLPFGNVTTGEKHNMSIEQWQPSSHELL